MKLYIIGPPHAIGGTELHLAALRPALREKGVEVFYVAVRSLWDIPGIARAIDHLRPDIIHCFLPRPFVIGSLATMLAKHKPKLIASRRSLRDCYRFIPFEPWLLRRCDRIVANSTAIFDELTEELGPHHFAKLRLIWNGVAPAEPHTTEPGIFTIVCLANFIPYKGHRDLLAALEIVRDRLPKPWKLILIGQGKPPKLPANVEVSDNRWWLHRCNLFVLPSLTEGFSNALLEAMALGLPCIATAVGGNLDAIVDGQSGWLIAPRDPSGLAEAIHELAWNPALCARLGAAARKRATDLFGWDQCLNGYLQLYEDLLCCRITSAPAAFEARSLA